ncbi:hypothetical protein F5B21DRAFT_377404 [Xylaria acuta]|nr:hypothetical protein F5B21DRAFT_377404 [Xylaria acuta]
MQLRYQLGEKWKWKKYNQGGVQGGAKPSPARPCKPRSQSNLRDAQGDEIIVAPNGSEAPGRDIASLRASLLELFTDRLLDEKFLVVLRNNSKPRDVSRCLHLCLLWCKNEIRVDDAQFPAPYGDGRDTETGITEGYYGCDVRIFIYLLHRYIGSSALADRDSWDTLAKQTVGFCPIRMLYTMSTLIVVVVCNALESAQEASLFDDLFAVAKRGVTEMDRHGWEDERLVNEFCDEFENILKDYANYGDTVSVAVRNYMARNWSGLEVHEELGFADDQDHHDDNDPCLGLYMPNEEPLFHIDVDDIMMRVN